MRGRAVMRRATFETPDSSVGPNDCVQCRWRSSSFAAALVAALFSLFGGAAVSRAQQAPSSFGLDLLRGAIADDPTKGKRDQPAQPRQVLPGESGQPPGQVTGQVMLVGFVMEGGQPIDKGIVWRVFGSRGPDGKPRVTGTFRDAQPTLQLNAGDYIINAAFGRASVTRRITVLPGGPATEPFMLNVGLLRLTALMTNNQPAPSNTVSFDVLSDDRDQFGQRVKVLAAARPGRLFRLNSGVYQIVSVYGDANATVQADLTVEPGKLTEASVTHHASRVTFKLVRRAGGEAIADTQWSIINGQGDIVKETAGALPSHLLAPGSYTVNARSQGQNYRRSFAVKAGETPQVEVLAQ